MTLSGAYGQMGKMIIQGIVQQADMQIVGAIGRPGHALIGTDIGEVAGVGTLGVLLNGELSTVLPQGDVVIEFTTPSATIAHLRHVAEAEKAMVIGTTGYTTEELRRVCKLATHIPCVMAPNMSIGANVLLQAIQLVASRLGNEYDVEVVEAHHHHKVDSPSGTALRMSEVLAETLDRKLEEVGVYRRHGITGGRTPTRPFPGGTERGHFHISLLFHDRRILGRLIRSVAGGRVFPSVSGWLFSRNARRKPRRHCRGHGKAEEKGQTKTNAGGAAAP